MGDEDDRLALVDQAADDLEELVDLARRQHGGGLVEDQDVGLPEQRLDQLDALLLPDRQLADQRVGGDRQAVALGELADARPHGVEVEDGPLRISLPSTTFSATVRTGISWKCWCTIPMPTSIASRGAAKTGSPLAISPASGW